MVAAASIPLSALLRPSSRAIRQVVTQSPLRNGSQAARTTRCPECYCPHYTSFASNPSRLYSSKRQLMTETVGAHRPESMPLNPLPPRNIGVPETSIAGGTSQDSSATMRWAAHTSNKPLPKSYKPTVSEQEAQEPAPISKTTSPTKPKSRLRARKAPMTLTPTAVSHVRQLLDSPEPKLIRVGVKNKGCSGSSYHLEYVDHPGKFDELVEQDGVKVLIDSKALIKVIGSEMDWVEDKLSARFVFKNPNIKEQCGCGESFSVG